MKVHKPPSKKLWAFICFTVLIFLNICFSLFLSHVLFFAEVLKIMAPRVGFSTIFLPQGSGFRTFFVGNSPFQKDSLGVRPGEWLGLELTDT